MIYKCTPEKVKIYHNTTGKTPEQIKRETGCSTIVSGIMFNPDGSLCCDVKIDGKWISNDPESYEGLGWNGNELPKPVATREAEQCENFLSCVTVQNSVRRGRTAYGFNRADKSMTILCTSDSNGAMTIPDVHKTMDQLCDYWLIADGGGSCYLDCPEGRVDTTLQRKTANKTYLLIWEKTAKPERKFRVCLDPGHGLNEPNCSPDKSYYEYQFSFDIAQRTKELLEATECFEVLITKDSAEQAMSLTERANKANAWGADLFLSQHSNAVAGGYNDKIHGLTVWIYAPGGNRERLAKRLLEQYREQKIELFGNQLYYSKFAVLARTNMPAALIEHYFHTCHSDVTKLLSDDERDKLAYAQACGICEYFNIADDIVPLPEDEAAKEIEVMKDIIYRVQVGAFVEEDNALVMAKELEKQGYKTVIKEEKKK